MNNKDAGMRPWRPNATATAASSLSLRSPDSMRKPSGGARLNSNKDSKAGPQIAPAYRVQDGPRWKKKPDLQSVLQELVSDEVAGSPTGGPRWIRRSLASLRAALAERGFDLGRETIRGLLKKQKIRPKANRKRLTPKDHPDRDKQFQYIQQQRQYFQALGWPIISVDTKNKELIGAFKNAGQSWSLEATDVYMHDFPSDALGRAVPYGIYDLRRNHGYVRVGQSVDTPEFAVDGIVAWWRDLGQRHYSDAPELLILADSGGMSGVLTSDLPSLSTNPMPATPARSTLAVTSPTGGGALKPVRSAVAAKRFLRKAPDAAAPPPRSVSCLPAPLSASPSASSDI